MVLFRRVSDVRLVNPVTAEMSDIELRPRTRAVRLVNPATAEMSDIELRLKDRNVRLVNPATGEMSDISYSQDAPMSDWLILPRVRCPIWCCSEESPMLG